MFISFSFLSLISSCEKLCQQAVVDIKLPAAIRAVLRTLVHLVPPTANRISLNGHATCRSSRGVCFATGAAAATVAIVWSMVVQMRPLYPHRAPYSKSG